LRKIAGKKGKDNPRYIDGRYLKIYHCKECNKEISKRAGIYGLGRCQSCAQSRKRLSMNTKIKIGKASKQNWKNKEFRKRNQTPLIKHHLYGKNFNKIIYMKRRLHRKLHSQAYFYILDKFGKNGIKNYIKWFEKKFKTKINRRAHDTI
jgi:ribosomal protein L37AE/L43A